MPASYRVIPDHDLLSVCYWDHHTTMQTERLLSSYLQDPWVRPGLRCLIDCSRLASVQVDVARRLEQLQKLHSLLVAPGQRWNLVYYCPTVVSQRQAELQRKIWLRYEDVAFTIASDIVAAAQALNLPLAEVDQILQDNAQDGPEGRRA